MIRVDCPWCGPRDQDEFVCGGQAHIQRPAEPAQVSDEDWARYQFIRDNPQGVHLERWQHLYGCFQWFNIARDTVSHEILATYGINDPAPEDLP